jgi:hypothetical protein
MEATSTHKQFEIFIDKTKFEVTSSSLTGAQLRNLPSPPVPEDRDLYLEVPGGEDKPIEPQDTLALKEGMHFFTVPKHINPGI